MLGLVGEVECGTLESPFVDGPSLFFSRVPSEMDLEGEPWNFDFDFLGGRIGAIFQRTES